MREPFLSAAAAANDERGGGNFQHMQIVKKIEGVGSGSGRTSAPVVIDKAGEMESISTSPKTKSS